MNLQSLVIVGLRLMALSFLLQTIVLILEWAHSFIEHSLLYFQFIVALMAIAILIWTLAAPIARWMAKDTKPEISLGTLTLADCYSVAFIGVGLYYLAAYLPQILNLAYYLLRATISGQNVTEAAVNGYQISRTVIPFIAGLLLFLNGRKWALALARRHTEEPKKKEE